LEFKELACDTIADKQTGLTDTSQPGRLVSADQNTINKKTFCPSIQSKLTVQQQMNCQTKKNI